MGSNLKEHDRRLNTVLKKASEHNLKLNAEKCKFRNEMVTYVGHQPSSDGVRSDPEKIREIKEMQRPYNQKSFMTFLGFFTYVAKFIPNLSQQSVPLRQLLEKDISCFWEKDPNDAFEKLKLAVISHLTILRTH